MLLAGCEATTATAQENTPDIDAIVQQSVAEAIAQYEETQKEKDAKIAELKVQMEELTSQAEESSDPSEIAPAEEPSAPASSQPEELETQPEPEYEKPAPLQASTATSRYDGFDLKNMYPAFIWENFQPIDEDQSGSTSWEPNGSWEQEYEEDDYEEPPLGTLLEEDALEVIRLTNQERESHGLELLEIAWCWLKSERRKHPSSTAMNGPDGTRVAQMGYYGENLGAKASAEKQVSSWMNSEGHRTNILREQYHRIGVGCYLGENGKRYWIQVFSK